MEEKILIKSEQYNIKKLLIITVIIGAILSVILFFWMHNYTLQSYKLDYDYEYEKYLKHKEQGYCYTSDKEIKCWDCRNIEENPTIEEYSRAGAISSIPENLLISLIPVAALALIGGLLYLWLRQYELTVTDKRVYGKVAFGKRVDLPVDSVSAIATVSLLKGVSISTSSGKISFLIIKNAAEIYKILNDLLIQRQQEKANATVNATAPKLDEADQLKKYKELLDLGIITQEEFEAKKKELLFK